MDQIITGIEYLQNSLTETIRVEREGLYTTRNSYVGKNRYFFGYSQELYQRCGLTRPCSRIFVLVYSLGEGLNIYGSPVLLL